MTYFVSYSSPRLTSIGRQEWSHHMAPFATIQEAYAFMDQLADRDDCRGGSLVQDVTYELWMKHSRYPVSYAYTWTSRVRGRVDRRSQIYGDIYTSSGGVWLGDDGCLRHVGEEYDPETQDSYPVYDETDKPIEIGPVTPHVQGPHCPAMHGPGEDSFDWSNPHFYSRWGGCDSWSRDLPSEPTWERIDPNVDLMLQEYFACREFGLKLGRCDRSSFVIVDPELLSEPTPIAG